MIVTLTALVALIAGTAIAGASAGQTDQTKSRQETIEGVLSLKEGHGDFLVRQPDGKTQRFSIGLAQNADITRNGQPARYNELKVNDNIKVQYDGSTREVIAIHAQGS
jgi:hypothetical protein